MPTWKHLLSAEVSSETVQHPSLYSRGGWPTPRCSPCLFMKSSEVQRSPHPDCSPKETCPWLLVVSKAQLTRRLLLLSSLFLYRAGILRE